MAYQRGQQSIALGFDEGVVVIKMGNEEPAASMDTSGKILAVKNTDVSLSIAQASGAVKDNEPVNLTTKDLGQLEVYPTIGQTLPQRQIRCRARRRRVSYLHCPCMASESIWICNGFCLGKQAERQRSRHPQISFLISWRRTSTSISTSKLKD